MKTRYSGSLTKYINALGVDLVEGIYEEARHEIAASNGTKNEIRNPGAYLRSKLENALANPPVPTITVDQDGQRRLSTSEMRAIATELVEDFTADRTDHANEVFQSLDTEARERIREAAWNQNEFALARLRAAGENSTAFRLMIKNVLEEEGLDYPDRLSSLTTYSEHLGLDKYRPKDATRILEWAAELLS